MPNQRPPNSFHDENTLFSDLVINVTPKLRTEPHASARHSRNERLTPNTPLKQNCTRKKAATSQPSKAGCHNSQKELPKKIKPPRVPQKKTNLHRSRVPACTHNLMTAFDISVELRYVSIKNWTDLGACFDHTHISQT